MNALPRDGSSGPHSSIKCYLIEHYDELYGIAARQMIGEHPGNSMQATALLNEAVCKLLDPNGQVQFNDSHHFLAAANVMMQHILVDRARHRNALKQGGQLQRQELQPDQPDADQQHVELLILREELQLLAVQDPLAAQIIQKRCEGYSIDEVAGQLDISRSQAYDLWNVGRAWLLQRFNQNTSSND